MQGSLALHRGSLYVGRQDKTARVSIYDLDGHERAPGFSFRDPRAGRSVAAGLAVDDDRQVWVADTPSSRVRTFTLFGREVGGIGLALDDAPEDPPWTDAPAVIRAPVDIAVEGDTDQGRLAIACAGERRHAVQLFDVSGGLVRSLRPGGDPHGRFRGVRGVALRRRFLYVAEAGGRSVQVFRDAAFHFAFSVPCRGGGRFEPVAVAPLDDGRMVVACGGHPSALLLVDGSGQLRRVLAEEGEEPGAVSQPGDVVVEPGADERTGRVAVIDRDGERVQVFTLTGRAYGSFVERA